jgi:hypothetical protein
VTGSASNVNPVGRVFYGASTLVRTPASRDQEVGLAVGAQAGETRLREVVTAAGFTHFRRVTETPFNLVREARPWPRTRRRMVDRRPACAVDRAPVRRPSRA